ncbi:CapA family protein [Myxococcota bacterium]|nr:CapA family protein [Myxococcota bacterium]
MPSDSSLTLFLCGDVMVGRGVDQVLPHPSEPELREEFVRDARDYVLLAERRSGPVPRGVPPAWPWGEALAEIERAGAVARVANLETSVTRGGDFWPGKGIHYRMSPGNVGCLGAAGLDVCVLANNHVMDFGVPGLLETLETLERHGIRTAGAGRDLASARRPAAVEIGGGRLLVFGIGGWDSGIPPGWAATPERPGVDWVLAFTDDAADEVAERVRRVKRPGDLAVVSVHWGSNWGYAVPPEHTRFAHRLVEGGVDLVHGHSSHHPRPVEVYRERLILYGCGDFINDYEGIEGYGAFRGDLVLAWFPVLQRNTGRLLGLEMSPLRTRGMRLHRASEPEGRWLREVLSFACAPLGSSVELGPEGRLRLAWT